MITISICTTIILLNFNKIFVEKDVRMYNQIKLFIKIEFIDENAEREKNTKPIHIPFATIVLILWHSNGVWLCCIKQFSSFKWFQTIEEAEEEQKKNNK